MINITMQQIKISFNAKTILTPAEKFQVGLLSKFGGYCRTVIRNSIKAASSMDQHAAPGQPPLYHHGPIKYRDTIFFVVDKRAKDVTIGGALLSGTAARGMPVPGILENGGMSLKARVRGGRRVPGHVSPHPHSHPAFDKAIKKFLPSLIKGGIMRAA